MGKKAIITAELIDESVASPNSALAEEMLRWFKEEAVPPPWVKEIKKIIVHDA
jgi:hypothetical protein